MFKETVNVILSDPPTLVCQVHNRMIQSGFSHVFGVYSEPIEIA